MTQLTAWFATAGTDRVAATLAAGALWVAAAWLAVGLLAAAGSRLPGAAGRCCAALGRAVLPRALRGIVAGSAGVGLVLAPVGASAAPLEPGPTVPVHTAPAAHRLPSPGWPVGHAAPQQRQHRQHRQQHPAQEITVRPGDSLWLLAARRLTREGQPATDAAVATAWPRWYAANRGVIGADPDVLHPGERLEVPAAAVSHIQGGNR